VSFDYYMVTYFLPVAVGAITIGCGMILYQLYKSWKEDSK